MCWTHAQMWVFFCVWVCVCQIANIVTNEHTNNDDDIYIDFNTQVNKNSNKIIIFRTKKIYDRA